MTLEDRRKREKEQRSEDIINAAEKLFFSKGYDNVSMSEIASGAEVNKALLYYYFKDKESLFFAIVLRAAKIFDGLMKESLKGKATGRDKLRAIGRAMFDFSLDYPDYYGVYFYSGSPRFHMTNNEYGPEIRAIGMEIMRVSIDAARDGLEDGSVRKGLDPVEVAVFLARAGEGILNLGPGPLKLLEKQGISREQFIDDSLDMLEHAVMATPAAK